jgi:hydrocephalus-inducing protein
MDLAADIAFPNLLFEKQSLDFGSVLLDTTRRMNMTATNTSDVDVVYSWAWDNNSVQVGRMQERGRGARCGGVETMSCT